MLRPRYAAEIVAACSTAVQSSTLAKHLRHNAKAPQCGALAFLQRDERWCSLGGSNPCFSLERATS